jgi:gamma-glutamylcyclotransferase
MSSFFYYFAFGSNLLTKRIHVQNKSAVRVSNGILKNFKLEFGDFDLDKRIFSPIWQGSPATIIQEQDSHVCGVVWKINNEDLKSLDKQEGVDNQIYKPLEVQIFVEKLQKTITCRTYQLVNNPTTILDPFNRPYNRQPSKTYLTGEIN